MASNNIFANLNDDSDNEAPIKVEKTTKGSKTTEQKVEQKAPATQNNTRGTRGERRGGEGSDDKVRKDNTTRGKYPRDGPKTKGVPSEPHPQDRKSGTGTPAYQRKFRKDGGGKGNLGTVKSELHDQPPKEEVTAPVVEETPSEPEVEDTNMTAEEYFKSLGYTQEEETQKVAERKLNVDELKRDKLEIVTSKTSKVLDQNLVKGQSKRKQVNSTYSVGCNTDHSDLLGVKSGHTLVKYVVKQEGEKIIGEVKDKKRDEKDFKNGDRKPQHNKGPRKFNENETDFPQLI